VHEHFDWDRAAADLERIILDTPRHGG